MTDSVLMTNKSQTKKYRSYSQEELHKLGGMICDNIEELLELFNIEYRKTSKMIISCCPIHGGDNPSAFNIYPYGENYRGNWKCRTHHCEEIFRPSIIGMVRGLLSHKNEGWQKKGDQIVSFNDTMVFIENFLNRELDQDYTNEENYEYKQFNQLVQTIKKTGPEEVAENKIIKIIPRNVVRKLLQIPAKYYIDRGYDPAILDKYDIGLCLSKGKEMFGRVVAPIYDNDYTTMIGCTGRSVFDKCENCKSYHNQAYKCPDKNNQWKYSKWKHSFNFKSQSCLYNYWFAKQYIQETGKVILVESPGNVWRLEENGIHNSVAMFGSNLSDKQLSLLDSAGAMTIIILTDNDQAGMDAQKTILNKCQKTHRIFSPKISKNDVGDMTKDEIQREIIDYLRKIK